MNCQQSMTGCLPGRIIKRENKQNTQTDCACLHRVNVFQSEKTSDDRWVGNESPLGRKFITQRLKRLRHSQFGCFLFFKKINDRLFKSFGFLKNPPKNKAEKIKSNKKKTVDQRWQRCVSSGVSFRSGTSSFYNSNRRISSVSYTHLYTLRSGWSLEWPRREPRITHSSASH